MRGASVLQPRGVSGKSISSRHFEATGAKTCQILLRDESFCRRMAEETYEYALAPHTYAHRVERLLAALG